MPVDCFLMVPITAPRPCPRSASAESTIRAVGEEEPSSISRTGKFIMRFRDSYQSPAHLIAHGAGGWTTHGSPFCRTCLSWRRCLICQRKEWRQSKCLVPSKDGQFQGEEDGLTERHRNLDHPRPSHFVVRAPRSVRRRVSSYKAFS